MPLHESHDKSSSAPALALPQIADCGASDDMPMSVGSANGWISVDDSLPEEDAEVVVIGPAYGDWSKGRFASLCTFIQGVFYDGEGNDAHPPSHWQNAPPAAAVSPATEAAA